MCVSVFVFFLFTDIDDTEDSKLRDDYPDEMEDGSTKMQTG